MLLEGARPGLSDVTDNGSGVEQDVLEAFDELAATDSLELVGIAPDPASAERLTRPQIEAALRRAHRHGVEAKAIALQATLRVPGLTRPHRSRPRSRP